MPGQYTTGPMPFVPFLQVELTCEQCQARYLAPKRELASRRFCSRACVGLFKRRQRTAPCEHWIWQGCATQRGDYGVIGVGGKQMRVNRAAWLVVAGPIPDGLLVCHTCDIPRCIRNDDEGWYELDGILHPRRGHVWLGTNADTTRDKVLKGRAVGLGPRGEQHGSSKLTDADVRLIRSLWAAGAWRKRDIARLLGVSDGPIYQMLDGKTWKHVE